MLSSCSGILRKQNEPAETDTVNQYIFRDYPKPEVRTAECKEGFIETIITGRDAVIINFRADGKLLTIRFPLTHLVRLSIPKQGVICYNYFDVNS